MSINQSKTQDPTPLKEQAQRKGTSQTITAAVVQQQCRSTYQAINKPATLEATATLIAEAATQGAQLVLLQELHATPYFCQVESQSYFNLAEALDGPTTAALSNLAKAHQLVIVGSIFERRAPGIYHNTAIVLERDGSLAGYYRKMHIPDDPGFYEKYYFTPGDADGFQPINTSIGRLGVMVCWDQWYPEAARIMALRGADILLYPTAIGWDPRDPADEQQRQQQAWVTMQRAHAIANHLPVLVANRIGHEADPAEGPGTRFWGSSFIAGPQGEWLGAPLGCDHEGVLIAELDLSRTESLRQIWPYFRDRRIDAYQTLTKRFDD